MILKIKLKKVGSKSNPFFHIVLMKALSSIKQKYIAIFGFYNPIKKYIKLKVSKLLYFIKNGAYPTKTVRYLLYNILKK
jgi:small subunit ribosomal protein S16